MASALSNLAVWFASNCDGDWEHGSGVKIETLDNPGWSIQVNLAATPLEHRPFQLVEERYDQNSDWLRCWVEGATFRAACGPLRLEDALRVFLKWAEAG